MMLAYGSERSILIQGPACSGKTSLCFEAARLLNSPYLLVPLQKDMEVKDLIGGISPTHRFRYKGQDNTSID
jgi:MoxR-like ATPase